MKYSAVNTIKVLEAICEGFTQYPSTGYIVVENPNATPENLALGGVDPNLVVDCGELIDFLRKMQKAGLCL